MAKKVETQSTTPGGLDQVGAWSYAGLGLLGLGMTGISIVAVPLSILWLVNGLWLGRKQQALELK